MATIDQAHLLDTYLNYLLQEQDDTRLSQELVKVSLRLIMDKDAHVPDTMTRIRVLPTVAVVGQKEPVDRTSGGSTVLDIYVKFLPASSETYRNLKSLSELIKTLPGIKIVRVLTLGGRVVQYKGKPIVV
jgi:hypothetical protein